MKAAWKPLRPMLGRGARALLVLSAMLALVAIIALAIALPLTFGNPVPYSPDLPVGTYAYADVIELEVAMSEKYSSQDYSYFSPLCRLGLPGYGWIADKLNVYIDADGQEGQYRLYQLFSSEEYQRFKDSMRETEDWTDLYIPRHDLEFKLEALGGEPLRVTGIVWVAGNGNHYLDIRFDQLHLWPILSVTALILLLIAAVLALRTLRYRLQLLRCRIRLACTGEVSSALAQYAGAESFGGMAYLSPDYLYCPMLGLILRRKDILRAEIISQHFPSHGYEYTLKLRTRRRCHFLCTVSDQASLSLLQSLAANFPAAQ